MNIKEINVKNSLKKITRKDDLFNGNYTIDPYQNCYFSCSYCDSSLEKTIYVKRNIAELLRKKIKTIPKSNIIIGSVHDPYQKIEEKFKITRNILKILKENNQTCNILTKSDLVLRDLDILKKINNCTVTISITTYDENLRKIFEKNVISADKRINVLKKLRKNNIKTGIAIIPIIPYITEDQAKKIFDKSNIYKPDFYLFRYLELKGDQKRIFLKIIEKNFHKEYESFKKLYSKTILPCKKYIQKTDLKIKKDLE